MTDLRCLREGQLVCVAGRVLQPAPAKKMVRISGEDIPVANVVVRSGADVLALAAWRELAVNPVGLEPGQLHLWEGLRYSKGKDDTVECRYTVLTTVIPCPDDLSAELDQSTGANTDGGNILSRIGGSFRDPTKAEAHWFTLSLCHAIAALKQRRDMTDVVQVPSVLLANAGSELAYTGCSQCKKGLWEGQPSCQCDAGQQVYWKGSLTLTDDTAQIVASAFDAIADLSAFWDEAGEGPFAADAFANEPEKIAELMGSIAAGNSF